MLEGFIKKSYELRKKVMKKSDEGLEILLSNFEGSIQQKDIEKRTYVLSQYFRTKLDVPSWKDPNFDWSDKELIMKSMAERFDMPSWALYRLEGKAELCEDLKKYNEVFIYQIKACNLNCPYCYVDDVNKNGIQDNNSRFFKNREIVENFKIYKNEKNLKRIRPSGGEPTLVLEQWSELLKKLEEEGLGKEVHVQSDTNLTTGHFIDYLIKNGELNKDILEEIANYRNFSLLASFKGTDPKSFAKNTRSHPDLFKEQFYSYGKFLDVKMDVYPFLYNPNPNTLVSFVETCEKEFGSKECKKIWIFPLKVYEVTKNRLEEEARKRSEDPTEYVKRYEDEWNRNFLESEKIMEELMKEKFNHPYKKVLRVGI